MLNIFAGLVFCLSLSFATEDFSGKDSMNDISFKDYKNFENKWSLVTIRFRKDTGEMRLTYANEMAQKVLASGSIDYPDGSVIAKIGFHTSSDPQFVSSVVPQGIRRYQFMVKNKKKYSTTNGWGYGLFDPSGKTFPESPTVTQDACYACHTIVENRGDVFSQPFSISNRTKFMFAHPENVSKQIRYESRGIIKLPGSISKHVPKEFKHVRLITNKILREKLFQGTLDEMKPILEYESLKSKLPALFASKDYKMFVLVVPTKLAECNDMGAFVVTSTDLKLNTVTNQYCTHD
jgi:hypothetical protein